MVVIDIFAISTSKGTTTAADINNKQNTAEYSNIVLIMLINNTISCYCFKYYKSYIQY